MFLDQTLLVCSRPPSPNVTRMPHKQLKFRVAYAYRPPLPPRAPSLSCPMIPFSRNSSAPTYLANGETWTPPPPHISILSSVTKTDLFYPAHFCVTKPAALPVKTLGQATVFLKCSNSLQICFLAFGRHIVPIALSSALSLNQA